MRADLDGHRHLRPAGSFGLRVYSGLGTCSFWRRFAALAPAVRSLTALFLPLFLRYFCSSAVMLRHPVNAYEETTQNLIYTVKLFAIACLLSVQLEFDLDGFACLENHFRFQGDRHSAILD